MRAVAVAALLGITLLGVTGTGAAPALAADAGGNGLLRLAHLSPDTPSVDVYVDAVADPGSGITLSSVGYGTISDYQDVPPGSYTVSMREAGADPSTPPVLSTTVDVSPGSARTVAGVGMFADLGLVIIEDELATPPPGRSRVRVLAGAASARTLDVALVGGTVLADALEFASTGDYVDVPAGPVTLELAAAGGAPEDVPVDLEAGAVYSLLVLDGPGGGLTVQPVLDAAGPGVVPQGGVEAGAGGTAASASPGSVLLGVGLTGLVGTALLTGGRRRGSRHAAVRR